MESIPVSPLRAWRFSVRPVSAEASSLLSLFLLAGRDLALDLCTGRPDLGGELVRCNGSCVMLCFVVRCFGSVSLA